MTIRDFRQITKLVHRDAQPRVTNEASVVDIHYRGGSVTLSNRVWAYNCPFLQFCALYSIKPSDYDGTSLTLSDESMYVPVIVSQTGERADVETMLDGGQQALKDAEWFDPDVDTQPLDESQSGVFGGGSPDPGTGNRGGVEEPSTESTES